MSYFQTKVRYYSSDVLFKTFFSVMSAFYWQNDTVPHELLKMWNSLFSTFFVSTIMTRAFTPNHSSEIWIIIISKYTSSAFLTIQIEKWENFELKLWQCLVKNTFGSIGLKIHVHVFHSIEMKYAVDLKETFINLLYISVEEEFFHQFFFIAKDIRLIADIMMNNTNIQTKMDCHNLLCL